MGIYQLNRFLKSNCRNSIREIHLRDLSGKIIVIDASIYLYKYAGEQRLVEGMYQLISTLLYYTIKPVFIFDGAPPAEKKALLDARHTQKRAAKREYYTIIESLDEKQANDEEKNQARHELERLQKKFVRLSKNDYENICELMNCFGVQYYRAENEADELCAKLVMDGKAWACMSEDSDMFVYGCPRVIRYLSLMHFTGVLYDMKSILSELKMDQHTFQEICVLSGTDYNYTASHDTSLQKTMQYYDNFRNSNKTNKLNTNEFYSGPSHSEFYNWLIKNTHYIKNYEKLMDTLNMFNITALEYSSDIMDNNHSTYNKKHLRKFLKKYNFIFIAP